MKYYIGFDVGASKTHALLVNDNGTSIGFGLASGGNHQNVGYDGLSATLKESLNQALQMAHITVDKITGAGFGLAGYDFPSDRPGHIRAISTLQLNCPYEIVNDGLNGLLAGANHGIGVNVTAGTSNNCRGRNASGTEGRIAGNGPMFGEYGGAAEITMRALQMVNYAWIKRIAPTKLTQLFLQSTAASDELDLMDGLSSGKYQLTPALASQISATASQGDPAATEIMNWAGEELAWLAISVARQLNLENDRFEIIQSGSVFEAGEIISAPMRNTISRHCPHARLIRLKGLPVVGAVMLAMEQAGIDGYPLRENIIQTAGELLQH